MREFLICVSFAGLLLTGTALRVQAVPPTASVQQSQGGPEQATKTVSGKVIAIGSDGTSFTLQLAGNSSQANSDTMQFVLDRTAKVQGAVHVGTMVTVEYAMQNNQNTAKTITAQS